MLKDKKKWRVVQYKGCVYIISPSGLAKPEPNGVVAADQIVARLNMTLDVEELVRRGRI